MKMTTTMMMVENLHDEAKGAKLMTMETLYSFHVRECFDVLWQREREDLSRYVR